VYGESFDAGSPGWNGRIEKRETFRHSPGSIRSARVRDALLSCAVSKVNHAPMFAFQPDIRIRMVVKAEKCRDLSLRLWDPEQKAFHVLGFRVSPGRWSRVDVDLREAFGRRGPTPGALITGIVVGASGPESSFVLDDLSIVRSPGPCPIALSGFSLDPECSCAGRSGCTCCRTARALQLLRKLEQEKPGSQGDQDGGTRTQGNEDGANGGVDKPDPGPKPRDPTTTPAPGSSRRGGGPGDMPTWPSEQPSISVSDPDRPRTDPGEPGVMTKGEVPSKNAKTSPEPAPEAPGARPMSSLNSEEKERLSRWLRSTLPAEWPPYAGWEAHCCGQGCPCLQIVKRYWNRFRMKSDE
jgi:hypothetical protein